MSTRIRLLLLTAIPTLGATVVCLWWRYTRRSKTIKDTGSAKQADQYSNKKSVQDSKPRDKNELINNASTSEGLSDERDCAVCNSLPNNSSKILNESLKDNKTLVRDVNNSVPSSDNRNEKISELCAPLSQEHPTLNSSNHTAASDILSLIKRSLPPNEGPGRNGKELQSTEDPDHSVTHDTNISATVSDCVEPVLEKHSLWSDLACQDPAVIMVGGPVQSLTGNDFKLEETSPHKQTSNMVNGLEATDEILHNTHVKQTDLSRTTAEFDLPTHLCGMLIGKYGRNICLIKSESGATIQLKNKVYVPEYQLVSVEGTKQQVNKAMEMIKRKFPKRIYPDLDFTQSIIPDVAPEPDFSSGLMQLSLAMNVQSDVFISCVVTPNHVFLQQPTHPTYPELQKLEFEMRKCYATASDAVPGLPQPYEVGVLCVAPVYGSWHRAQIVQVAQETEECDVRLVDVGGYVHINGEELKQIRCDFMALPFQAIECYLASVLPPLDSTAEDGYGSFPTNANQVLETLSHRSILSAEIIAIETDGIPYIRLYNNINNQIIDINRALVEEGVASWYEM